MENLNFIEEQYDGTQIYNLKRRSSFFSANQRHYKTDTRGAEKTISQKDKDKINEIEVGDAVEPGRAIPNAIMKRRHKIAFGLKNNLKALQKSEAIEK